MKIRHHAIGGRLLLHPTGGESTLGVKRDTAQRFAARLLAERGAEPVDHRPVTRPSSAPRSITPH